MTKKARPHPLYVVFLLLMLAMLILGIVLIGYGSATNGIPVPTIRRWCSMMEMWYG